MSLLIFYIILFFVCGLIISIFSRVLQYFKIGNEIKKQRLKACIISSLLIWCTGMIFSGFFLFYSDPYAGVNILIALLIGTPIFSVGIIISIFGLRFGDYKSIPCWVLLLLHNFPLICFYLPYQRLPYYTEFWLMSLSETTDSISLSESVIDDKGLRYIKKFKKLNTLFLSNNDITDKGLDHIESLKDLETLGLANTQITNAGLMRLRGLKNLRYLNLSGTNITDEGLTNLTSLVNLRNLSLSNTNVSSKGLTHINKAKYMKILFINGTKIDDSGLEALITFELLGYLNIANTNISDSGIEYLKKHLPSCDIIK